MKCVATAVRRGTATDDVVERALNVMGMLTIDMDQALGSAQLQRVVTTAVDVFRGISRHLSSISNTPTRRRLSARGHSESADGMTKIDRMRQKMKACAENLCNAVTRTTAPGAAPVGSVSADFSFNCQKVEEHTHSAGVKNRPKQVYCLDATHNCLFVC